MDTSPNPALRPVLLAAVRDLITTAPGAGDASSRTPPSTTSTAA